METKEIGKQIFLNNDWINGRIDFRDGDLSAQHNAEYIYGEIIVRGTPEETAELLKKWDNVNVRYDNLIFISNWKYGCFVYDMRKTDSYIEHYTLGAISEIELADKIRKLNWSVRWDGN